MSRALVLIGLSGSGKSTVARFVASKLELRHADTDRVVEGETGLTVAQIFSTRGEQAFREIEASAVAATCRVRQVVSTGAGAPLRASSREQMRAGNLVVWLDVPVPIIARRLAGHAHGEERPLLTGEDLERRLQCMYDQRRQIYKQTAHVRCASDDAGTSGSHRIATELAAIYRAWEANEEMRDE